MHPPLKPFGIRELAAPTGREASAFDARAIQDEGVPQAVLMENAGRGAAAVLQRLHPKGLVLGLVGSGNNGGDARVLLRTLAAWGRDVRCVQVADREPDGLLHGWRVPCVDDADLSDEACDALLASAAVIVDGILGTGLTGPPRERQARIIRRLEAAEAPVVALDVPSGVDADTGAVPGVAVRASTTVAFGAPKLGCLLHPGRAHAGRVVAVELGFPPLRAEDAAAWVVTPALAHSWVPVRASDTHKNAVGRLLVVGGGRGMAGAAIMAAQAGFRAGAGLVQVCSAPANRTAVHAALPEAVFVDSEDGDALEEAAAAADAVAAGPGLGTDGWAADLLARALGPGTPAVLDADALNMAAAGTLDLAAAAEGRALLLTPHPGEMARLRGGDPAEVRRDPPGVARAAAAAYGAAVVLKGAPSLTAAPDGSVLVDVAGTSDLAVAGMGDVLTGVCGGLMAQGVGPHHAGATGLFLTGRAATLAGRGRSLMPTDVIRWLPTALSEKGPGVTDLDLPFVLFDLEAAR